jgi:hypothetical protein
VEEAVVTPAVLTDPGALEMHFQPIAMPATGREAVARVRSRALPFVAVLSAGSLTMTEPA